MKNKQDLLTILLNALVVFILFFALIRLFINTTGTFFALELGGLFFLLLLSLIAAVGYSKIWGKKILLLVYIFYIINLLLIWKLKGPLYLTLLLLSIFGAMLIVMDLIKLGSSKRKKNVQSKLSSFNQEPYSEVFDPLVSDSGTWEDNEEKQFNDLKDENKKPVSSKVSSSKGISSKVKESSKTISKSKTIRKNKPSRHSPGKYVASARSNIYHAPKCEWAKKINSIRRVWFKSKEAAWEKGYKAHNCVE